MGNAMRVPTHTANDNRRQQAQHFAPHIPGVYEPAKDGLARPVALQELLAQVQVPPEAQGQRIPEAIAELDAEDPRTQLLWAAPVAH